MKKIALVICVLLLTNCGPSQVSNSDQRQGNSPNESTKDLDSSNLISPEIAARQETPSSNPPPLTLALCDAIHHRDIEGVRRVLENKADLELLCVGNTPPLHNAARMAEPKLIMVLLEYGASLKQQDVHGSSPLHHTANEGYRNPGHIGVAWLLINKGVDVNARDNQGKTPLHFAEANITELLLDAGADVNARDNRGWTPLHSAAHGDRVEKVKLLLEQGANPRLKDNAGNTPLDIARQTTDYPRPPEIIQMLTDSLQTH